MIDRWIAEATECDFKVALEVKKPKSWLKSVSAFANGIGGTLLFGIDDNRNVVGLTDAQADAEAISRLIKERISPYPNFILVPEREDGKNILILTVSSGYSTPYYYKADGVMEAYIRIGNESVIAPSFALNQLILKGMNRTYDTLNSEYDFKDYAFSKLRERYKVWTGNSMEDKLFDSFDIRNEYGKLTNAGALLADNSPIRHSRLFCTRWNGLDKSGGMVDALDSAEYSGSLIILLNEGVSFVKRNMKTRWKKTANSRIEMPEYCERSVFEALVNALIHRDYLILGSEVHMMTVLQSILPAAWLMEHGYRKEIYPIFPPLAAIPFSPIFSDGWVIWSVKEAALRRLRNLTMLLITIVKSWNRSSIPMLPHSKSHCIT